MEALSSIRNTVSKVERNLKSSLSRPRLILVLLLERLMVVAAVLLVLLERLMLLAAVL